jgi:hypothetical protein
VQNKMLWAVTGKTAAELIEARSDPNAQNMGLTNWKGLVVRKGDVGTAKNYLKAEEVEELNRTVVMYLDYAEDQAKRRRAVTMADRLPDDALALVRRATVLPMSRESFSMTAA